MGGAPTLEVIDPRTPAEVLAEKLNGREYGDETTPEMIAYAKEHGLVIVFGASDDLMEFRGAIDDEAGAGEVNIDTQGILPEWESVCDRGDKAEIKKWLKREENAISITANFNDDYTFTYDTTIPHKSFDIKSDGDNYCRGIVFALADATASDSRFMVTQHTKA